MAKKSPRLRTTPVSKTEDFTAGRIYRCLRCGKEHENPTGKFYKSQWSKLWLENDKYCPICKTCINELFDEASRRYKDDRMAAMICCHYLDFPFYHLLYDSIIANNNIFSMGLYARSLNNRQYQYASFQNTLTEGEVSKTDIQVLLEREDKWSASDKKNKDTVIQFIGYDPFEGQLDEDRRFLFNDIIKYLDDEDIAEDNFKLSQVIQIVNNNNQIRKCDLSISAMNPVTSANDIKSLSDIKNKLVMNNDKIAKENEISVKNRSNKDAGKSTLTFLMRNLREKGFEDAEVNFYDQLRSEGSLWAVEMSLKAIKQNAMFDENDAKEIMDIQRDKLIELQRQLDEKTEENRLLFTRVADLEGGCK